MFNKDVTLKHIGEYLTKFGWSKFQELPEPGEKEGIIITGWTVDGGAGHQVTIDPIVEKGAVVFQARKVAMAPPNSTSDDRLGELLLTMAALNYKLILGSWGMDPSDGEVVFRITLSVQSGQLEYEDFEHALSLLIGGVEATGPELNEILKGTKSAQEVIAA
jgi:hypothetical protein